MSKLSKFAHFLTKGVEGSSNRAGSEANVQAAPTDGVVKVFDVVLTPVLFAMIGLAVDYKFSTAPIFTLTFLFFGVAGMAIKLWYGSFGGSSSNSISHNGESSTKVVRRSSIVPVSKGDLLGGDLAVPDDLDLTFDGNSNPKYRKTETE